MAKTAIPDIKSPHEWLDEFEDFPILEILPEVMDMLTSLMRTNRKKVESKGDGKDEVSTTESLMVHALSRGLLIADFKELSVGMILDYIARYDLLHSGKEEEKVKLAGQKEFNEF